MLLTILEVDDNTYLLVIITASLILQSQEKMKRKLSSKTEENRQGETSSVVQSQYAQEKLLSDSHATTVDNKVVSVIAAVDAIANVPTTVVDGPNMDRPKQEKVKGNSNDMKSTETLARKKQKIKPELVLSEFDVRSDKLISQHGEEKNTSLKHVGSSKKKKSSELALHL